MTDCNCVDGCTYKILVVADHDGICVLRRCCVSCMGDAGIYSSVVARGRLVSIKQLMESLEKVENHDN